MNDERLQLTQRVGEKERHVRPFETDVFAVVAVVTVFFDGLFTGIGAILVVDQVDTRVLGLLGASDNW